ncbi:MAG: CapA family protein [Chloroflexi bacterium]|nr:CapA family protein [Chloroflexota bacterium]
MLNQARPRRRRRRGPLAATGFLAVLAVAIPVAMGWGDPAASPSTGGSPGPSGSAIGLAPSDVAPPTTPPPTRTPVEPPLVRAIVPATQFRTPFTGTTREEVLAVLAGTSERYVALEMVAADADEILYKLGTTRPADPARLIEAPDGATLNRDLALNRNRLALLRADEVGPGIRALAWEGESLFGVDRAASLGDWPLMILEAAAVAARRPATEVLYDPAAAWTLVAGGDILLDRGVALTIGREGVDFPFDGGTAEITGHTCCSQFGWETPLTRRTGNAGVVRSLIESADLAIANFENPAPVAFRFHSRGTVFTADPAYLAGLANVGLDYVSLANNHIRDAGATGILQTIAALDDWGIEHSGAGANLAAARTPALLEPVEDGPTVAILGYDTIARSYFASTDRAGSAQLTADTVAEDVAAAREAGADLVIVFPHWGTEYRAQPFAAQRRLAQACIDAGADIVIGNHAHWAGAVEIYEGKPIWYALGNFVFDQTWSEPTMEGITLELTFNATRLVQAVMRPHIILDKAQPNFMDPAGDGAVVMNQVYAASKDTLPW